MEEIYAHLLLRYVEFQSRDRYNSVLNANFLSDRENEIYLELEECSSDLIKSMETFKRYLDYECNNFNSELFGKRLFLELKDILCKFL